VYRLDDLTDTTPTLLHTSDTQTVTGRTPIGSFSSADELTFTFPTTVTLSTGLLYGIAFTETASSVPATRLVVGSVNTTDHTYDTDTFIRWSAWEGDKTQAPWGIGTYKWLESTSTAWALVSNSSGYTSEISTMTLDGVTLTITGYWQTHDDSVERLWLSKSSILGVNYDDTISLTATTTGAFSYSTTIVPDTATMGTGSTTYTLNADTAFTATLWREYSDFDPFTMEGTASELLDSRSLTLSATSSSSTINIQSYADIPEFDCSITQPTGCLKNAGVWLFYPSPGAVDQWTRLPFQTKVPFSYVYDTPVIFRELFETAQDADATIAVDIPFVPGAGTSTLTFISKDMIEAVPYTPWIKTTLGYILWFMLVMTLYRRTLRLHDQQLAS